MKVWENLKKLWKHLSCFLISHELALVNSLPFFVLFYCTCCKVFKIIKITIYFCCSGEILGFQCNGCFSSGLQNSTAFWVSSDQVYTVQYHWWCCSYCCWKCTGDDKNYQVYFIIVTILSLLYHWHRSTNTFRLGRGEGNLLVWKMYVMAECKCVEIVMQMHSDCMKNKNVHNFHETAI